MSDNPVKILIVDDRPENLYAMRVTLAPLGVEMVTASSGNEALALMLRHDFALVLLDVQMPGMDGFETATLMQNNQATRGVPIIFVTAISKERQHVFKGYETGAVDYLFKPLDADILLGKVKVFVSLHQAKLDCARMHQELIKNRNLESLAFLAGGVAHDFNNILTAIMGNVGLCLLKTDFEDERYPLLVSVEQAALRAKCLTSQLLTFAKGGDPVKKIASIAEVITQSADFVLRGRPIACHYDLPDDLNAVAIDTGQMSQVIQNIVINSIQAMPGGGRVTISARNISNADGAETSSLLPGSWVVVTIHDSGPGIPADLINKIFDPYFTTKESGSGLGLAISHSIVKKHGGAITASSRPGHGTTFTITLPSTLGGADKTPGTVVVPAHDPPLTTGRIMIMDDDDPIREMACKMLDLFGYQVVQARDGNEALALYRKNQVEGAPIDVVIMDLTIPGGMGGKEAIAKLLEFDPQAKVIVASGYANDDVVANYRDYGFVGMISKPFLISDLRAQIAVTLSAEKDS